MKFGVIVRSICERTEQLCFKSIKLAVPQKDVYVIRNAFPFSEAVRQMLIVAKKKRYDFFVSVDADTVLAPNWLRVIRKTLQEITDIDLYYKLDFQLQDRFVTNTLIYGLHLYNGKYIDKMLKILSKTRDSSKPEGNIRHKIDAKFTNVASGHPIGYHGYEQYYREIYNRFAVRSFRNPEDRRRYKLFKVNDEDNSVGWKGWIYGLKHKDTVLNLLDARNKILSSEFGYKEKSKLEMELKEFYENAKR